MEAKWNGTQPNLKTQLQELVVLLQQMRGELEREYAQKVETLNDIMQHTAQAQSHRVEDEHHR